MKIFGREIEIRPHDCSASDEPDGESRPIRPAVTVYATVTNDCPAHCPFCSNAINAGNPIDFDILKLLDILREIRYQGIDLSRLCITGGEPSSASKLVREILEALSDPEFADLRVHLSTNGISEEARRLMAHPRWTTVTMSLHHYKLERLRELYGLREPIAPFASLSDPRLSVTCNLICGYIDSPEQVGRMLKFVDRLGVSECGFVALRQVNDWCRRHYVPSQEIFLEKVPHVVSLYHRYHENVCRCANYLYAGERRAMPVYIRETFDSQYCESVLLFDGRHLRQGFGGNAIII